MLQPNVPAKSGASPTAGFPQKQSTMHPSHPPSPQRLGHPSDINALDDDIMLRANDNTSNNTRDAEGTARAVEVAPSDRQMELAKEPVVLRLRHLGKSYSIEGTDERVIALKDIHLCEAEVDDEGAGEGGGGAEQFGPIHRGEFVMIRGPSGGGKTTLLNIIGTIDSCTEGTVELEGEVIDSRTKENHLADVRLHTLGFVFQTFNLISTMTAAENVELPMTLMGKLSDSQMRLRARQLLTLVGLRNRVNHLPSELSGGEQQRVTIARSLANNPTLLLLDEPTGDLDTLNTIDVMDLLVRINRSTKMTCIMVTHNPDIECYADRILYVSDGKFQREAKNIRPSCLDADAYAKYLEEKERQATQITRWDEREGGAGAGAGADGGGGGRSPTDAASTSAMSSSWIALSKCSRAGKAELRAMPTGTREL